MARDVLEAVIELSGVGRFTSGFRQMAGAINQAADEQERFNMGSVAIGAGAGAISLGVAAGLKKAVEEAGKFEAKVLSFNRLFGQGEGFSRGFLKQLQEFSLQTPYAFGDISEYAVRLNAMGFSAEKIIPIFRTLGDANAVLNQGSSETFQRILLAIGQIQTRGKAVMQEINQLTQAQVPAFEILREKLGLTGAQMGELGRQGIDAKTTLDALFSGMRERYGGAMEIQLNTIQGRIGQIQNAWQQFLIEVGKPVQPGVLTGLTMVSKTIQGMTRFLQGVPGAGGAVAGGMMGVTGLSGIVALTMAGQMLMAGRQQLLGAGGAAVPPIMGPTFLGSGARTGTLGILAMMGGMALASATGQSDNPLVRQGGATISGAMTGGAMAGFLGSALAGTKIGGAVGGPWGLLAGALLGGTVGYLGSLGSQAPAQGQSVQDQILTELKKTAENTGRIAQQGERREAKVISGGDDLYRSFPEGNLNALVEAMK